jgi:peptidoglycan hydrolase CwlO-like protein
MTKRRAAGRACNDPPAAKSATAPVHAARLLTFVLAAAVLATFAAAPAAAATLAANRAKARVLIAEVNALDQHINRAVALYAQSCDALATVQTQIAANRRAMDLTRFELDQARQILLARAVMLYKQPGVGPLDVLFQVNGFSDMISQLTLFTKLGERDSQLVAEIAKAKRLLHNRSILLAADLKGAKALVVQRAAQLGAVRSGLGARQHLLAGLQQDIVRQVQAARSASDRSASAVDPPGSGGGSGGGGHGTWWPLIKAAAGQYGINASGMYRLMMAESGGRANSVSYGLYYGLYQYSPGTWHGDWNPWRSASIFDGPAQIKATALAIHMGKGPYWWPNTYPWAF